MQTLQERLIVLEKEQKDSEVSFTHAFYYKKIQNKVQFLQFGLAYVVVFYLTFIIVSYKNYPKTFSDWLIIFLYSIYPGAFATMIIGGLLSYSGDWLTFKITKLSNSEYKKVEEKRISLEQQIASIKSDIRREKEKLFAEKLNDFVFKLEKRRILKNEAISLRDELIEEDSQFRKLPGYYHHGYTYYSNRFTKIKSLLDEYDTPIVQKIIPNIPAEPPKKDIKDHPLEELKKTIEKQKTSYEPQKVSLPIAPAIKPVPSIVKKEDEVSEIDINSTNIEKEISELFTSSTRQSVNIDKEKLQKDPVKIDYLDLNAKRQTTGSLGEKFALEWERMRLEREGLKIYADKLLHKSVTDDSLGYDILSFSHDGTPRYIEVKTTTDHYSSPFYLTETEIASMNKLNNYFIYRIYNFNLATGTGTLFTIDCDTEIDKYFEMKPISFRVSPK